MIPDIDFDGALRQAASTAETYLCDAVRMIDAELGTGYAAKHPELIAQVMKTQTEDFNAMFMVTAAYNISDRFICVLDRIASQIEQKN